MAVFADGNTSGKLAIFVSLFHEGKLKYSQNTTNKMQRFTVSLFL